MNVTLTRFGRKRRLVLMLEWLTLWPTRGPLAVSSQRRDLVEIREFEPPASAAAISAPRGQILSSLQGAGGRIGGKGPCVKFLGRLLEPPGWCAPSPAVRERVGER